MSKQGRLAVAAALGLALMLCAASLQFRRLPRPSSASPTQAAASAATPAPVLEAASAESARQASEATPRAEESATAAAAAAAAAVTTLELQVLRADGVAHDARAWLVAGYYRELPADLRKPPPGYDPVFAAADPEGVLRFPALAPGPYRIAIELDDLRLEQGLRVLEAQKLARLVLRLGAATIEGCVYDDAGAPVQDTLLRLSRPGYGRNPPPFECFTRTDANGFYRLRQVGSGLQTVSTHPGGSMATTGAERECLVPFTGVLRIDFGSPALEGVRWSGSLRNSSGDPVPGPGEFRIQDEGKDEIRTQPLRADGSFELHLRPGRHHLRVQPAGFFPEQVDLGLCSVPPEGLERDLVVPGARLRLRLTLPAGWDGTPNPSLRAKHEGVSVQRLVPLADGSWVHDGLEPGDYVLGVGPLVFEDGAAEHAFTLPPGAGELTLDLRLELPR